MKPSLLNIMYVLNTKKAYKCCYFPIPDFYKTLMYMTNLKKQQLCTMERSVKYIFEPYGNTNSLAPQNEFSANIKYIIHLYLKQGY